MHVNEKYSQLASEEAISQTKAALEQNGISVVITENKTEAKNKVFELIPKKASVMNMTSMTLEEAGIAQEILESGRYDSIRNRLTTMDNVTQIREKRQLGAAPDWVIGSVHAVTQDGKVLIGSNTGSQLPAYAYGAQHVVWVIGTQKIVKDLDDGMKRLYEYSLPLEHERSKKAYGGPGSHLSKILIINKEIQAGRITAIFVKEKLGF